MKTNITGFGPIPGIGTIAPAYNVELDHVGILRLMNFPTFRVFDAETGTIITRKNVKAVLESKTSEASTTHDVDVVKEAEQTAQVTVIEEPVEAETSTEAEIITEEIRTTEAVVEDSETDEEAVEATVSEEETATTDVETSVEKPKPYNNYNHKNKKRR